MGCGVDISCNVNGCVVFLDKICGMFEYLVNYGCLCVKGINLLEINSFGGCLFYLIIVGEKVEWDIVMCLIVDKII